MTDTVLQIPLGQIRESDLNPRKRFDQVKLGELAESVKAHGMITPAVARQVPNGKTPTYELAAGHRRFRAAQLAGLETMPVVVRDLDDKAFLEILTIENLQREDLHPLEEAQSFADLVKHAGYDAAKIAARIHRNTSYVYDRLTLLQLIKPAQKLFLQGRIPVTHAILIARLTKEQQETAIDPDQGAGGEGVFTHDHGLFDAEDWVDDEKDPYRHLKPVSEKELRAWIDKHCRLELDDKHAPQLFPEALETVSAAAEAEEKVIKITTEHHVLPEAKAEGERTWSRNSWKRADGKPDPYDWGDGKPSKTCEHSVTGVVVVGHGRGEAFKVCTAKKQCKIHWREEMQAAERRAKGAGSRSASDDSYEKQQERWKREEAERKVQRARWEKATPAILDALAAKLAKAKTNITGAAAKLVLGHCKPDFGGAAWSAKLDVKEGADDVVRMAAFLVLGSIAADSWTGPRELPKLAKQFGVDVGAIVKTANATDDEKAAAAAEPAKAKKKAKAKK